jgi:hypothetical protein
MFDVSAITKRYFDIRIEVETDDGETKKVELQVEPPKVKQLNKLIAVSSAGNDEVFTELRDAVRDVLSKNKTGYKVPEEYVDNLDTDQLTGILSAYLDWVAKEKQTKN